MSSSGLSVYRCHGDKSRKTRADPAKTHSAGITVRGPHPARRPPIEDHWYMVYSQCVASVCFPLEAPATAHVEGEDLLIDPWVWQLISQSLDHFGTRMYGVPKLQRHHFVLQCYCYSGSTNMLSPNNSPGTCDVSQLFKDNIVVAVFSSLWLIHF